MKRLSLLLLGLVVMAMILVTGCAGTAKKDETKPQDQVRKEDNSVFLVQTTPPNMLKQLEAKEIDGFIAWEPFNSDAVNKGYGKYLFKSPDVWDDHPCCVVAVGENFKDPRSVEALTWAHVKATRFINDPANKEKVVKYAAEFTGRDEAVVRKALENITYVEYPAKDRFEEYYDSLVGGNLLKKSLQDIGFADQDKFFTGFLNESVYKKIAGKLDRDPAWTPSAVPETVKLRVGYLANDLHQLALWVAEREGYYKNIGLEKGKNYEAKTFPNGVAVMEAFKSRDIDMAYLGGAPATLKRINDNISIEVIAGANNEGSALVVGSGLNIKSVADLKGKTIAIPGVGTVQYTLLDNALKKEGLRPVLK